MPHKLSRKLSLLVVLSALAGSAWALTIGLAPSEAQDFAPPPEGRGSPMRFLVSGALDALFESGYISTDAPVSRTELPFWGPANYGLRGARAGQVDYVVALYVEWAISSFHKDSSLAAVVHYRILRSSDGSLLADGLVTGPSDTENSSSHEARSASQAGNSALAPCLKILATLAMGGE